MKVNQVHLHNRSLYLTIKKTVSRQSHLKNDHF